MKKTNRRLNQNRKLHPKGALARHLDSAINHQSGQVEMVFHAMVIHPIPDYHVEVERQIDVQAREVNVVAKANHEVMDKHEWFFEGKESSRYG